MATAQQAFLRTRRDASGGTWCVNAGSVRMPGFDDDHWRIATGEANKH